MKTIEEERNQAFDNFAINCAIACAPIDEYEAPFKDGFNEGVEVAQGWIDVADELPKSSEIVLVKFSNNEHRLAFVNIYHQFIISMLNNYEAEGITHWCQIELK